MIAFDTHKFGSRQQPIFEISGDKVPNVCGVFFVDNVVKLFSGVANCFELVTGTVRTPVFVGYVGSGWW